MAQWKEEIGGGRGSARIGISPIFLYDGKGYVVLTHLFHSYRSNHSIIALDLLMAHHQAPLADCHMDILWVPDTII